MAAKDRDRLKPSVENEGVSSYDNANSKTATDPSSTADAKPKLSHNVPLPLVGDKRKAPALSPDDDGDGGGQKKARPFAMNFGAGPRVGALPKQDVSHSGGGGVKMTMTSGVSKPLKLVTMKLGQKSKEPELKVSTSKAVAKAFGDDSDDEEEEMPPEAKMRMKNVGRETITSAGPNSFNKSSTGFNDQARVWKKSIDSQVVDKKSNKK